MDVHFDRVLDRYPQTTEVAPGRYVNVMTVLIRWDMVTGESLRRSLHLSRTDERLPQHKLSSEEFVSEALSKFCRSRDGRLELIRQAGVRAITFFVVPPAGESTKCPGSYTFKTRDGFKAEGIEEGSRCSILGATAGARTD